MIGRAQNHRVAKPGGGSSIHGITAVLLGGLVGDAGLRCATHGTELLAFSVAVQDTKRGGDRPTEAGAGVPS